MFVSSFHCSELTKGVLICLPEYGSGRLYGVTMSLSRFVFFACGKAGAFWSDLRKATDCGISEDSGEKLE